MCFVAGSVVTRACKICIKSRTSTVCKAFVGKLKSSAGSNPWALRGGHVWLVHVAKPSESWEMFMATAMCVP